MALTEKCFPEASAQKRTPIKKWHELISAGMCDHRYTDPENNSYNLNFLFVDSEGKDATLWAQHGRHWGNNPHGLTNHNPQSLYAATDTNGTLLVSVDQKKIIQLEPGMTLEMLKLLIELNSPVFKNRPYTLHPTYEVGCRISDLSEWQKKLKIPLEKIENFKKSLNSQGNSEAHPAMNPK